MGLSLPGGMLCSIGLLERAKVPSSAWCIQLGCRWGHCFVLPTLTLFFCPCRRLNRNQLHTLPELLFQNNQALSRL